MDQTWIKKEPEMDTKCTKNGLKWTKMDWKGQNKLIYLASLTIVTDIHLGENHLIAIIIAAGFPGQLGVLYFTKKKQ